MLQEQTDLLRAASLLLAARDSEIKALQFWLSAALANIPKDEPVAEPGITFQKQPLYMSDEEEDIQWQYDHEMIDLKTYEALLKELNFENSEVQFAEEYASENFHY